MKLVMQDAHRVSLKPKYGNGRRVAKILMQGPLPEVGAQVQFNNRLYLVVSVKPERVCAVVGLGGS